MALVKGDTNGFDDVFRIDTVTHRVVRVDVGPGGQQSDRPSYPPGYPSGSCVSDNGRDVAFASSANDLVPEDTNNSVDFFVRDVLAGVTERDSVSSSGQQTNSDYSSCTTPPSLSIPAVGEYQCGEYVDFSCSISADGRYVAFDSVATNLAPGASSGDENVYRHDRLTGETLLVSGAAPGAVATGAQNDSVGASMSGDGDHIAFHSWASDLVAGQRTVFKEVFVHVYPAAGS